MTLGYDAEFGGGSGQAKVMVWIDLDNERDDVSSCEGALRVTLNSRRDAQVMYAQHRTVQVSDDRPKPINQLGWYVPSTSKFLHGTSSKGESRPQFDIERWEHGEVRSKFCEEGSRIFLRVLVG